MTLYAIFKRLIAPSFICPLMQLERWRLDVSPVRPTARVREDQHAASINHVVVHVAVVGEVFAAELIQHVVVERILQLLQVRTVIRYVPAGR